MVARDDALDTWRDYYIPEHNVCMFFVCALSIVNIPALACFARHGTIQETRHPLWCQKPYSRCCSN